MVQDLTAFRKISFQTVDVEVALAEIEYQYLEFICEATLRNSDEVLREQIRHLQIAGLPSFDEWRKQDTATVKGVLPSVEAKTLPTTAIESNADSDSDDSDAETPAKAPTPDVSDRKPATSSTDKPSTEKPSKAKPSSSATDKLLKVLSEQATAKLTSREVIEQQHEQLTVLLKEGKTMEDLADLLTSNGAKISASTLRNYLSAARRKAKAGNATTAKKTGKKTASVDAPSDTAAPDTAAKIAAPDIADGSQPDDTSEDSIAETATDTPAQTPTKGSSKAVAKSKLEHETSVTSAPTHKPSTAENATQAPVLRRRKGRI